MIARTTIALDSQMLRDLKSAAQEEDYRSLSSFMKDVLLSYLKKRQEGRLFAQMKEDYKEYAKGVTKKDWNAFKEMETMVLGDLNKRNPWK